ncbi:MULTISPECIES: PPE domain-containing protein [unclassified Nocardia]|uniref:PPE domain-containing protein n=1 Tax=unclassified Nocardia TaxID=2637762 RepID=UPI00278C523C|nr:MULTISPECIES: PPE domain-containing protein [unclassified Nocardia]
MTNTMSLADLRGQVSAPDEPLRFEPRAAAIAVQACGDLVGQLRTVQESLDAGSLDSATNLRDFAGPYDTFGSGRKWSEGFRQLGRDLSGVVASHISIVTELSELYRTAAIEFARAEQESEAAFRQAISGFDGIKMPDKASGPAIVPKITQALNDKVPTPDPVKEYSEKPNRGNRNGVRSRAFDDYQVPTDGRAVWPENPFSYKWNDFYNLGQNIFSTTAVSAASHWEGMRATLETAANTFKTEIGKVQNYWSGNSASMAAGTVSSYLSDIEKLTPVMSEVQTRLLAAAGWLRATNREMPDIPQPEITQVTAGRYDTSSYQVNYKGQSRRSPTPDGAVEPFLKEIQFACEAYYVAGIAEYNESLGSLSLPRPTVQLGTITPPIITDDPNTNGNPTINNGAPTVTTGSPGTTPNIPSEIIDLPQDQAPTTPNPDSPTPTDPTTPTNPSTTTDTTGQVLQTLLQQGAQLAQSAVEQGTQAVQQGLQTAQQIAQQAAQLAAQQPTIPTPTIPTTTPSPTGTQPTVTGGGSPTTTSTPIDPSRTTQSRLFPRASISDTTTAQTSTVARAGLASASATTSGTSGMPMMGSPGAAGAGQQGSDKEHKRPAYLRSGGHLEDVFDAEPVSANAVVERGK